MRKIFRYFIIFKNSETAALKQYNRFCSVL
nr:MAG TPA: hypothetical protein [Caudoviricetes sp.]DAQ88507.1 MAG TPA: hypothetical protein [Caudoviricetes sp.]